jgi:uncharacterized membrane protein YeaQ/YmgE (transglycosylase-associated protein family)
MSFVLVLLVGAVSGWLAGQNMKGAGYGLIADIAIGLLGGLIGAWLFTKLGIGGVAGVIGILVAAIIGAFGLIAIIRAVQRGSTKALASTAHRASPAPPANPDALLPPGDSA